MSDLGFGFFDDEPDPPGGRGRRGRDRSGVDRGDLDFAFLDEEPDPPRRRSARGSSRHGSSGHGSGGHGSGGHRRKGGRRRRKERSGALAAVVVGVFLALLSGAGVGGYVLLHDLVAASDYAGSGTGSVVVQVKKGDTATAIGETLQQAGVVKSARAFVKAAKSDPASAGIQPGYYRLRREMKASLALELLLDKASRVHARVVVPEGTRASKILQIISKETKISLSDLKEAASHPADLGLPPYAHGVEGYLFPATYPIEPGTTAEDVLRSMVTRFKQAADDVHLKERARRIGMDPDEVVTLASLTQAEARDSADFPKVAAVAYNRLDRGMRLQFDSTVNYALERDTLRVSKKDLQVRSPYNTYLHEGLPPGPIASPGEEALKAALYPAKGDWVYFVTTDPEHGVTKFTDDYEEFKRWKREFQQSTR